MSAQAVVVAGDDRDAPIPAEAIGQQVTVLRSRERPQFLVELQDGSCYWVDISQLVPPKGDTVRYAEPEPTSSSPETQD